MFFRKEAARSDKFHLDEKQQAAPHCGAACPKTQDQSTIVVLILILVVVLVVLIVLVVLVLILVLVVILLVLVLILVLLVVLHTISSSLLRNYHLCNDNVSISIFGGGYTPKSSR